MFLPGYAISSVNGWRYVDPDGKKHSDCIAHLMYDYMMGEFLSKMGSNFRWHLGRVPTVGGATMAIAESPMQHLF